MNTTDTSSTLPGDMPHRAASMADEALSATRRVVSGVAQQAEAGIDSLSATVPEALGHAAEQVEDLARRGIERARRTSAAVRDRAARASDQTVGYIKDEPVKAVLAAAAAGAAVALLVSWFRRSRSPRV